MGVILDNIVEDDFRPRVLSFGSTVLDCLGHPFETLPEEQKGVRLKSIRHTPAGTAAGTAVDFSLLGASSTLVGAVGDDPEGSFLLDMLRRRGVNCDSMVALEAASTGSSILLIQDNGERLSLHCPGANARLRWSYLENIVFDQFDAVHFGGLDTLVDLDTSITQNVLSTLGDSRALVSMDFQSSSNFVREELLELLPLCDLVVPNIEQASGLTGENSPLDCARALVARGVKRAVVTCGPDGAVYADSAKALAIRASSQRIVDSTGCGDAFCAAFVVSLLRCSDDVELALRCATAAARLVSLGLGSDGGVDEWVRLPTLLRDAPECERVG